MGLKNKLGKMKNFFFDDGEEEEKPAKKVFKKPIINKVKEIDEEDYTEPVKEKVEDFYLEDVSEKEEIVEPKSRVEKQEKEFKFPEFNDNDFMVASKPEPIVTRIVQDEKPMLYQGSKKRKEEVKRFKPSPIISPIYGLLGTDGNKIDEEEKQEILSKDKEEISIDDVRKKAYGKLDDELDNTMKRLSQKTIAEAEADMEDEEKEEVHELSRSKKTPVIEEDTIIKKEIISHEDNDDEDDDMILPNVNFKEIDIDVERNKDNKKQEVDEEESEEQEISNNEDDDDDDDDTKEQDLFNLIDTMYQEGKDE